MCIKWRRGKIRREEYIEERRELKEFLKIKREEKKEEMELKSLYNTADVWRCINKKRGRKSGNPDVIKMEEWEEYFIGLLDGKRVDKNNTKEEHTLEVYRSDSTVIEEGREKEEEKKIKKEIYKAIEKMGKKRKKASEIDGIPMEAWIYGGKTIKDDRIITENMERGKHSKGLEEKHNSINL